MSDESLSPKTASALENGQNQGIIPPNIPPLKTSQTSFTPNPPPQITPDPTLLDPKVAQALESGVNQGVIPPTFEELSKVSGVNVSAAPILAPNGNWQSLLSAFTPQSTLAFDSLGCNCFAGDNGVKAYLNALGDITYGHPAELSDRKVCVDVGLNGTQGSSQAQWQDAVSTKGFVVASEWPFTPQTTEAQFFTPIPSNVEADGIKFLIKYQPLFRLVATDIQSMQEALKLAPLKVFIGTGTGWNNGPPFVIQPTKNPMGHAVLVYAIDEVGIHAYDQYAPYKKTLALNYTIYFAFQTILINKLTTMNNAKIVKSKTTPTIYVCYPMPNETYLSEKAELEGITVPTIIPNTDSLV